MLRRNQTLGEPRAGRRMEAEDAKAAATTPGSKKPPSLPPALLLMRARSRTSKVLDLDSASSGPPTPPLRPPVTVPFLWEEAPGKPKLQEAEAGATPAATATVRAERAEARPVPLKLPSRLQVSATATATATPLLADGAEPRTVPLKLPPRLQVPTTAEQSISSPRTVLHGPYGGKKPRWTLRRSGSTANFRRRLGAAGSLFSWRKATVAAPGSKKHGHDDEDAAPPDSSGCSPAASLASSSSSSALSYFVDDHGSGAYRRQADGGEEEGATGSVRITRFRRNRSLPSMTASHLWASIRKSVKQITQWN